MVDDYEIDAAFRSGSAQTGTQRTVPNVQEDSTDGLLHACRLHPMRFPSPM